MSSGSGSPPTSGWRRSPSIIVGKYFLPIFLKNRIYTMPEFLERRYSPSVRTVMAVFWLGVYVFVNLTAILWLGATAVHTVAGVDLQTALVGLGLFAGAYALVRRPESGRAHRHRAGLAAGARRPDHQLHRAREDLGTARASSRVSRP